MSANRFGEGHNLSYQQLVFYAMDDTRLALTQGHDIGRHVMALYSYAYPLAKQDADDGDAEWLEAWRVLERLTTGKKVSLDIRHRQFTLLTELFWRHGILSLRGVPFAEIGNVTRVDVHPEDEQEEWEP